MEAVLRERMQRGRTGPHIVIDARRDRFHGGLPDSVARLETQSPRHVDLTEFAVAHLLNSFLQSGRGAALATHLHDAIVFPRRRDDLPGLEHVVRARFFHVDVLAGLAGPDGLQGMPVIRAGDGDGVDALVLENLADVAEGRHGLFPAPLQGSDVAFRMRIVHVHERGQFDVRHGCPRIHVAGAAATTSDHRDAHGVIGTGDGPDRLAGGSRDGTHYEVTSIHGSP